MKLSVKQLPLGLLCVFFAKSLITGIQWPEATVILVLAALSYLYEHKSNDEQIKELLTRADKQDKKISDLNDSISSARVANSYKSNLRA